jgi:RNase P subunit RPR2
MYGIKGRLPTQVGRQTVITCNNCGNKYSVTYHGPGLENDTYTYKCSCGHELFTETNGEGYEVKEIT